MVVLSEILGSLLKASLIGILIFWGDRGLAQTHVFPPISPIRDPNCAARVDGRCLLKAEYGSFEFSHHQTRGLTMVMKGQPAADGTPDSVLIFLPVLEDLDSRVAQNELSGDEATRIAEDLAAFDGTVYALPSLEVLRRELGFPNEARYSVEDLPELVRAHLQVVLGVSPITASYLAGCMGVSTAAPAKAAAASLDTTATQN